eukprot:scaffold24607_cov80-Skeletonema_marinoi.AAC.1
MPPIVMPCNDGLPSRIFKARTSFLYVDEWRQSSGTEVTVVSKVQHQTSTQINSPVAHLLISWLPGGQWQRYVACWKALELLYRPGV